MGDKEVQEVETRFTSNWQSAQRGFGLLGQAAQQLGGRLSSLTAFINPLSMAIGALSSGLAIRSLVQLNSQFEQTQNVIGGTLSALGFAAGTDPTERFRNGLLLAENTMRQIQTAAAALPGEAQDYITVFQSALPNVAQSIQGSIGDLTNFTNQITAIGRSFGIDAVQIGMDTQRMLQAGRGGAGMDVRTFMQLLPFMKSLEGHANLTADSFNRMTQPERAQLLQRTFALMGPMLEQAGGTWDAMWGALQATGKELLRIAGRPIFDGLKRALETINGLLVESNGDFTELGQMIINIGQNVGTMIVEAIEQAAQWAQTLYGWFQRIGESPMFRALGRIADRLGTAAQNFAEQHGMSGAAGVAGGGMLAAAVGPAALTGPGGLLALGGAVGFANFLTNTEAVGTSLGHLIGILDSLSTTVEPVLNAMGTISNLLGDLFSGILPGLLGGLGALVENAAVLWGWFANMISIIGTQLRPMLSGLWSALGRLAESLGRVLGPAIRIVGIMFAYIYQNAMEFLIPGLEMFGNMITWVIEKLADLLTWLGNHIEDGANNASANARNHGIAIPGAQSGRQQEQSVFQNILDSLTRATGNARQQDAAVAAATNAAQRQTPQARGGGRTHQDFRYSRFEIQQKFEEGFDPDRIAVMFAEDVGRIGARLQSGFEPLFSVR